MSSKQGNGKKDTDATLVNQLVDSPVEFDILDADCGYAEQDGDEIVRIIAEAAQADHDTAAEAYKFARGDATKAVEFCKILREGVVDRPVQDNHADIVTAAPSVHAKKKTSSMVRPFAPELTNTPESFQSPISPPACVGSVATSRSSVELVVERPDADGYEVGLSDTNWFYEMTNVQKAHALYWSYAKFLQDKVALAPQLSKVLLKATSLDSTVLSKRRDSSLRLFDSVDELLTAVNALSRLVPEQYVDAYNMLKNVDDDNSITEEHGVVTCGEYQFDLNLSSLYVPTNKIVGITSHVKVPKLDFDFLAKYVVTRDVPYSADLYLRDVAMVLTSGDGSTFGVRSFSLDLGNDSVETVSWKLTEATLQNLRKFSSSSKGIGDVYVQLVKFLAKNQIVPIVEYRSRKRLISTVLRDVFGTEDEPRCYEVTGDKTHPTVLSTLAAYRVMRKGTMLDLSLAKDVRPILCKYRASTESVYLALNHSVVQKGIPAFEKLCLSKPTNLIYGGVTANGGSNLQYSYFKQACAGKGIGFKAFDMQKSSGVDQVDAGDAASVKRYVSAINFVGTKWVAHLDLSSHSVDVVVSTKMNETVVKYATNFLEAGAMMVTFKACLFAGLSSHYQIRWLTKNIDGEDYYVRGRAHAGEGVAVIYNKRANSNQFSCIALARSDHGFKSVGREMIHDVCAANLRRGLKRDALSRDGPISADLITSAFKPSALVKVTTVNMELDDYAGGDIGETGGAF
jgi:hypothetical protein